MKKLAQARSTSTKTHKKILAKNIPAASNLNLDGEFKEGSSQASNEQETRFLNESNGISSSDNEDIEKKGQLLDTSVREEAEEETRLRSILVIIESLKTSLLELHSLSESRSSTISSLPTMKGDNFCLNLGLQEGTCEFKRARDSLLDRFTTVNYRLVKLIEKCMNIVYFVGESRTGAQPFDIAATVCLQDFQKNPQLPSLQQFLGMRLWRNIENSNKYLKNHLGKFIGESKTKVPLPDNSQETSFHSWYASQMALEFENDLREICSNSMNEAELTSNTSEMKMLFDCINLALKSFDLEEADRLKRLKP